MFHRERPVAKQAQADQAPTDAQQGQERPAQEHNRTMEQTAVARHAGRGDVAGTVANENASGPVVYTQPNQPAEEKDTKDMNASENQAQAQDKQNTDTPQGTGRMDIPGGAFQRPGQPAAAGRVPGAYPGAYPGSAAAAPAYAGGSTANDAASGPRLIIGPGITLSGEIEACEHLVVQGTVEAALKGASILEIAETGAFYGTVEIDEATVAGRFEGDLTVKGRLTIRAGGSITGAIAYKELAVEAGAILDGKVTPLDSASKAQSSNRKVSKKTDNTNELPFADKAASAAE